MTAALAATVAFEVLVRVEWLSARVNVEPLCGAYESTVSFLSNFYARMRMLANSKGESS
jgi:hypothetical protein